jgi:hypothetical protein
MVAQMPHLITVSDVDRAAKRAGHFPMGGMSPDKRTQYAVSKLEAVQEINGLFDETVPLFGRYMRMDQKLPKLPFFR